MKSLLLVIAALGAARAAVTCDECRTSVQDFVSHLLSQEGITEQTDEMKAKVCPQVIRAALSYHHRQYDSSQLGLEGCEDILDMWYADMATCIFNHFIIEGDACSLAGKF